jgi:hypothetical protein
MFRNEGKNIFQPQSNYWFYLWHNHFGITDVDQESTFLLFISLALSFLEINVVFLLHENQLPIHPGIHSLPTINLNHHHIWIRCLSHIFYQELVDNKVYLHVREFMLSQFREIGNPLSYQNHLEKVKILQKME